MPLEWISAFLAGLMGATHCLGMCGGIVSAISLSLPGQKHTASHSLFIISYNAGRLISYSIAGIMLTYVVHFAFDLSEMHTYQNYLKIVASLIMLSLGLYLGGWWMGLSYLEKAGGQIWRKIQPFSRKFLPVTKPSQAFMIGILWGWLPCGLVYSALIMAMSSAEPLQGGLIMLFFGLGTLPMLMMMGYFTSSLTAMIQKKIIRQTAGGAVIIFALYQLYQTLLQLPG